MFESCCPQCKKTLNGKALRLVKDSCGHEKCRVCLLLDELQCNQCNEQTAEKTESVIKFDRSNGTVSTSNGTTEQNGIKDKNQEVVEKPEKSAKRKYESIVIPEHVIVMKDPVFQYKCTKCDKVFGTRSHVKYHSFCTGGKKPFVCATCGKDFILKSQYEMHMARHSSLPKPHKCEQCGKTFAEKSKLKRHCLLHTLSKAHGCSECGKAFRSKESLKLHTLTHRNERRHVCHLCRARFTDSSNLNRHMATHSNEKAHMCDQCGKRFKLKWALTVHKRAHLGERQFECSTCSKAFLHNKDLQRHQLTHLGSLHKFRFLQETKPYGCKYCTTSFRRKDNLHRHVKNAHPGKKTECKIEVEFVRKQPDVQDNPKSDKTNKYRDNPNAIKVIMESPVARSKVETVQNDKTVINGPLKWAFKPNAFKSNYNIQRTYDMAESVNICQKILSPATNVIKKLPSTTSNEACSSSNVSNSAMCQKILSLPRHEIALEQRNHATIKNIKFKLPVNYTSVRDGDAAFKDIMPLKPVIGHLGGGAKESAVSRTPGVIVNQQDHWRRRTWQNLKVTDH